MGQNNDTSGPNWYTSVCFASLTQFTPSGLIEKNNIVSSSFEIELINLFNKTNLPTTFVLKKGTV